MNKGKTLPHLSFLLLFFAALSSDLDVLTQTRTICSTDPTLEAAR